MEHYRLDNTDGYTQEELDELNRRFKQIDTSCMEKSVIDAVSEQILEKFDSEKTGK